MTLPMDARYSFILVIVILAVPQDSESVAVVSLTQETPCVPAQSCRLRCSVKSGSNDNGLVFRRDVTFVVTCPIGRDSCRSEFPDLYSHTQVDYSTSYLDIRSFNASRDATTWRCVDGVSGTPSSRQVLQNVLPTGSLTWGSTCVSGRVTSPASLSCSGLSPGTPPATLAIVDSSNQTVASSQTGSVTWTVTRGGQASCSVTWSAIPSFPLNITTIQCDGQIVANVTISVRNTTGQGKVVTCQAEGHPDTYTFQPWLQSWGGQEVRNVTGSQQGGQYNLTLTSYQDTGIYTCTVHNGVQDRSNQTIWRNANVTVTVEAAPVLPLPSDPLIVSGEDGEPVRLYRSLYASPDLVNHTWFVNSTDVTSLIPGATTNRSRDMVMLPVHGTTVTTEGTVISLTLTVSQQYSGLYRLQACNTIGCSSATVTLVVAKSASAALVGGVVGGCLGLIAIVVIIIIIVRLRRRRGNQGRDDRPLKKSMQEEVALGSANPTYGSSPDEQKHHSAHPILDDEESNDYSYDSANLSPSTSALQGKGISSPPAAPIKDVFAVSSKKAAKNDVYAVPDKKGGKAGGKGNTKSSTHEKPGGKMNPAQDPEKPGPVRELRGGLPSSTVEVVQKPGQAARPVLSKKSKSDTQYKIEPVDYVIIDHTKRA